MSSTLHIPSYAVCPFHGAEHVKYNISIRFYQCLAPTQEGEPGFVKNCTAHGKPICAFQVAKREQPKPNVYDERDFGGAFDGVRVTSDADGGL